LFAVIPFQAIGFICYFGFLAVYNPSTASLVSVITIIELIALFNVLKVMYMYNYPKKIKLHKPEIIKEDSFFDTWWESFKEKTCVKIEFK